MRILTFTSLFPNAVDHNHGVFIQNRLFDLIRRHNHQLQVVAPVPYFPEWPGFGRWSRYSQIPSSEIQCGVSVFHPRYLVTPKVGMTLYGCSMFLGSLALVSRLQSSFDFQVIDAHFLYPDAFAAILMGQTLNRPVVVSARGSDVHLYSQMKGIRPLLRFVLRRADAVIAVCATLKEAMVRLGVAEERVHVIGNGVDLSLFHAEDRFTARRQLGLPSDKRLILCVAQVAPVKGIHHLVAALPRIRQECPNAELLLVGKITEKPYHRRLQKQIAQAGLGTAVRFVGSQPHSWLKHWYNACDVFSLCSAREGWPNVLLEAMACGKPVVASQTGGIPDIVSSREYGLLVDPRDHEGLAAAIVAALKGSWNQRNIVEHASQHGWDRVSNRQQEVFEKVLRN